MIRRILVGIADKTYSTAATRHAIEFAKICDAKLTSVSILDADTLFNVGPVALGGGSAAKELREERLEHAREIIEEAQNAFIELCDEAGVTYDVVRETGDPLTEFIDASRYHDMVVVGLHRLFEHGVVDDAPDNLIKLVSSGVRPMFAVSSTFHHVNRILVAYSGSIESARTLRGFAQHRFLWPDTKVRIVTFGSDESKHPSRLQDAQDYLRSHGIDADVEFVNKSSKALLSYAEDWNADLIVMGNSAKNLLRRRIFGEVALKTIREAKIPLFLSQ